MNDVVVCRNLSKHFREGRDSLTVLDDVNLTIERGQTVAILGRSGSGKSTLLHLLGGLDKPSNGEVLINDINIAELSEPQLCRLRNKTLGFIYQFHHLLPEFTALENVAMPLLIGQHKSEEARETAKALLEKVGLAERIQHKPSELSGGERQRVAIARALVSQPHCVLADEPTGNLDKQTADHVFNMMLDINRDLNTSLVIVTHDESLAAKLDVTYVLEDGKLRAA
tara:strand:- start:186444 stop:187121 length:678 start_codon:yes stop_codon:yes gene_type:complete